MKIFPQVSQKTLANMYNAKFAVLLLNTPIQVCLLHKGNPALVTIPSLMAG